MVNENLKTILGEELFTQVAEKIAAHPGVVLDNVAEGYVAKSDLDSAKAEAEAHAATTAAQLAELTAQLETGRSGWADEKLQIQKDHAIERALIGTNAKNITDFAGRLDREKITLEDGNLIYI